jgi:hypothetical protein
MMRIKSDCVAYIIVFSLIFTLPLFGCAENVAVRKPLTVASSEITKQAVKKEDLSVKEENKDLLVKEENKVNSQKEESNFFNFN